MHCAWAHSRCASRSIASVATPDVRRLATAPSPPGEGGWAPDAGFAGDLTGKAPDMNSAHPPLPEPGHGAPPLPGQPIGHPMPTAPPHTMDCSPEDAGMVRRERPGMGLVLVCVGALLMVIALFLPWVSAGLIEWPSENPVAEPDRAGLFSMVSTVRDATEGARRAPNPGTISSLVFGWLLVVLTAVSIRSEEHTSELQSLMRISYAVFCLKKKN